MCTWKYLVVILDIINYVLQMFYPTLTEIFKEPGVYNPKTIFGLAPTAWLGHIDWAFCWPTLQPGSLSASVLCLPHQNSE